MNFLTKTDMAEEWEIAEFELGIYNSRKFSGFYFLRRIVEFLRTNPELCKSKEYNELYEECIVLLTLHNHAKSDWTYDEPKNQQETIEFLIDLESAHEEAKSDGFDRDTVEKYLDYRKNDWKIGGRYTKDKYGFV